MLDGLLRRVERCFGEFVAGDARDKLTETPKFASLCYGFSAVPVGELLVGVSNAQNGRLLKRPASNLQPNWQAVGSEATGERYGGQACQIEGHVQAQQRRCRILFDTVNTDLLVGLLDKNGRNGQRG